MMIKKEKTHSILWAWLNKRMGIKALLLLVLTFIVFLSPQVVFASSKNDVNKKEGDIEKKYNIKVTLGSSLYKDESRALRELKALDEALAMMPKGLVNKLSAYFKSIGKSTEVKILISEDSDMMAPASYQPDTNTIVLRVPGPWAFGGNGTSPDCILHEFGHMLNTALDSSYGSAKLKSSWTDFNQKKEYIKGEINDKEWDNGYNEIFVSRYGASSYREDFAETFMYSIYNSLQFREAYQKDSDSPMVKKSALIKKLLKSQLEITPEVWMIYPQYPSKKSAKEIEAAKEKRINVWEHDYAYQYKINKENFTDLLMETLSLLDVVQYIQVGYSKAEYAYTDCSNLNVTNAYDLGFVTSNKSKLFYPNAFLKRKDVANILLRVAKYANLDIAYGNMVNFEDCKDLSYTSRKTISIIIQAGLMQTTGEDTFSPNNYCTYEEAILAFNCLYDLIEEKQGIDPM